MDGCVCVCVCLSEGGVASGNVLLTAPPFPQDMSTGIYGMADGGATTSMARIASTLNVFERPQSFIAHAYRTYS